MLVETEAIILRTYKLAEADKIVVALTRRAGVVRGVARGARRLRSRFGAGLEPPVVVDFAYFEKEGQELVSVKRAEVIRSYFDLARHRAAWEAAMYMSLLVGELIPANHPDERVFVCCGPVWMRSAKFRGGGRGSGGILRSGYYG